MSVHGNICLKYKYFGYILWVFSQWINVSYTSLKTFLLNIQAVNRRLSSRNYVLCLQYSSECIFSAVVIFVLFRPTYVHVFVCVPSPRALPEDSQVPGLHWASRLHPSERRSGWSRWSLWTGRRSDEQTRYAHVTTTFYQFTFIITLIHCW